MRRRHSKYELTYRLQRAKANSGASCPCAVRLTACDDLRPGFCLEFRRSRPCALHAGSTTAAALLAPKQKHPVMKFPSSPASFACSRHPNALRHAACCVTDSEACNLRASNDKYPEDDTNERAILELDRKLHGMKVKLGHRTELRQLQKWRASCRFARLCGRFGRNLVQLRRHHAPAVQSPEQRWNRMLWRGVPGSRLFKWVRTASPVHPGARSRRPCRAQSSLSAAAYCRASIRSPESQL